MSKTKPLITAVIPTYRRPQLLKRAVLSALNQTYPHVRVCVYDDASGDNTREVMEELMQQDSRVFYYEHSKNVGPFDNFELGVTQVSTPYFSVLSDDDVLLPEFYKQAMEGFDRYPEAAFVATKTLVVNKNQIVDVLFDVKKEEYYTPPLGLINASHGKTNTWTGSVYRRDAVKNIRFDRLMFGEPVEQDFLFRVIANQPYLIKPVPGAIFIVHNSSMSASRRSDEVVQRYHLLFSKIKSYPDVNDADKEIVCNNTRLILADSLWQRAIIDLKEGNFDLAMKISKILRDDFSLNKKAMLLYVLAKTFKLSRIIHSLALRLHVIWKNTKKIKQKSLNDRYGSYLRYLAILN